LYTNGLSHVGHSNSGAGVSGVEVNVDDRLLRGAAGRV
jgi:hypothetical protein